MTLESRFSGLTGRCLLVVAALACVLVAVPLNAATPAATKAETADGLKVALNQAVVTAVTSLGRPDGFLANPEVRIPLPGKLQKAAKKLRKLGMSKQTDALELAMNRSTGAGSCVRWAPSLFPPGWRQRWRRSSPSS